MVHLLQLIVTLFRTARLDGHEDLFLFFDNVTAWRRLAWLSHTPGVSMPSYSLCLELFVFILTCDQVIPAVRV